MFIVPTYQDKTSRYVMQVSLSGDVFRLYFDWNSREQAWFMDIRDKDDNNILTNLKMVINYRILYQYQHLDGLPAGDFVVLDREANPVTGGITYDNFGIRYPLVFFSNTELTTGVLE
ncbi:MAG: phage baseplate plug protein [Candidatus Hodarchaeota archaeon]